MDKIELANSEVRRAQRETMVQSLGLLFQRIVAGDPYCRVERYHWGRKDSGARWDRFVDFTIYHDESFSVSLDANGLSPVDREACLRRMVKA